MEIIRQYHRHHRHRRHRRFRHRLLSEGAQGGPRPSWTLEYH